MVQHAECRDHAALILHVVWKEMRGLTRAPWVYGMVVVVLGLIGWAVLRDMPRGAPTSMVVALYTRRVLTFQVFSLFSAALLVVPFLAIYAVQQERHSGTGDLVALTRLEPVDLVLGKAVAAFLLFALLGIATMPMAGLGIFLSGVDIRMLLQVSLHLGALGWCCACTGVAMGTWTLRLAGAWFYSIAHTVLLCVYPIIFGHLIAWAFGPNTLSGILYSLAPFTITGPAIAGRTVTTAPYPVLGFFYLLVCGAVALWIATRCWTECSSGELTSEQPAFGMATEAMNSMRPPIPDGANPVFAREKALPGYGSDYNLPYVFFLGVLWGAFALMTDAILPAPFISTTVIDYTRVLAVLAFAPPLAARALLRENEEETLDQLRVSALTPRQIITGKTRALIHGAAPFLAGLYVMSLVNSFLFDREPLHLVTVHCLIWVPVYFLFLSRCAMIGTLLASGSLNGLVAGYGLAMVGATAHFVLDTVIMLDNAGVLLRKTDAVGLTVFWCIDAVFLFVLSIMLADVACRLLERRGERLRL